MSMTVREAILCGTVPIVYDTTNFTKMVEKYVIHSDKNGMFLESVYRTHEKIEKDRKYLENLFSFDKMILDFIFYLRGLLLKDLKFSKDYQAKLNYLVNDTANATITGVAIYHFNYTILFDGTTGIYLKEVVLNDGEMATVSGEFYKDTYNGQVRMRNITILSTETSVEPEPVVLDKVLDNSWLLDSSGDTTSPEDHALWIYRFVTASGTLTSLDNDGKLFEFEYPIESGTATITVYTYTAVSTCTDTPATVTGYLAGYKHVWQIYPRTPSDIEF